MKEVRPPFDFETRVKGAESRRRPNRARRRPRGRGPRKRPGRDPPARRRAGPEGPGASRARVGVARANTHKYETPPSPPCPSARPTTHARRRRRACLRTAAPELRRVRKRLLHSLPLPCVLMASRYRSTCVRVCVCAHSLRSGPQAVEPVQARRHAGLAALLTEMHQVHGTSAPERMRGTSMCRQPAAATARARASVCVSASAGRGAGKEQGPSRRFPVTASAPFPVTASAPFPVTASSHSPSPEPCSRKHGTHN